MAQSINLIPKQEQTEQIKTKLVRSSTIVTILLLIVVVLISAYFFYRKTTLTAQIHAHERSIEDNRTKIQSLSEIEIVSRNLDKRYQAVQQALGSRIYYSRLMTELYRRVPEAISITEFNMSGTNAINISGVGQNYIAISEFIGNLVKPTLDVAGEGLEAVFTDVALHSVNLDSRSSGASYFIVVTYDPEVLR